MDDRKERQTMRNAILTLLLFGLLAASANPAAFWEGLTAARGAAARGAAASPEYTMLAWYDASDTNAISSSLTNMVPIANNVRALRLIDKSGNGRTVSHINASGPFWYSSPARIVTDTSKIFSTTNLGIYANGGATVFAVVAGAKSSGAALTAEGNSGTANTLYELMQDSGTSGTNVAVLVRSDDNTSLFSATAITGVPTNITLIAVRDTGTEIAGMKNGAWGAGTSYTRSKALTLNRLAVMGRARDTVQGWQGTFHELVYIAPTTRAGEQLLEGQLAWKWDALTGTTALVDALPADHPYKAQEPPAME